MKQFAAVLLIVVLATQAGAQEFGRVLSVTPVVQQVSTPRQVCSTERVLVGGQKSGNAAAVGALVGGAVGNALAGGKDRGAATVLGMVGGALVGDRFEPMPPAAFQDIQRCSIQQQIEHRTAAYTVVYEFGGRQYSVQMPHDPGPTIALRLLPADAPMALAAAPVETISYVPPPVIVTAPPPLVVYQQPLYRSYAPSTYLTLRLGDGGGGWGRHHRHDWH